jgi:2-keto-3-deoxy-galactonokinase
MSGLLIGVEMQDALGWLRARGKPGVAVGIGSPDILDAYGMAASLSGLELSRLESAAVVPRALLSIARAAGLVT